MSVRPVPFAGRLGGATLQPEALATSSRSAGLGRRLAAANIVCSAGMQDAGGPGAGGPGRSSNPGGNAPVFKVPSGKELERMRQFRQQQQYRQQQKIRQLQRDGPRRPPDPPPPVTAPTLQPRGRAGQQPTPSSEPRVDSPGPSKRKVREKTQGLCLHAGHRAKLRVVCPGHHLSSFWLLRPCHFDLTAGLSASAPFAARATQSLH